MTKALEFWEYAEEALVGASESTSDKERQGLIKLAHLWSRAALRAETPIGDCIDSGTVTENARTASRPG
jgi:hypothetical protein